MMISMPGGGEWIIISLVILLLFGAKKLPGLARAVGSGINEFKKGISGHPVEGDDESDDLDQIEGEKSKPSKGRSKAKTKSG